MQANRLHRSNVGLAELKGASAEPLCGLKRLTDRLIDHLEYEGEREVERERGLPTALSICLLLFLGSCWQLATGDKLTSPRKWPSKQPAADPSPPRPPAAIDFVRKSLWPVAVVVIRFGQVAGLWQ